MEHGSIATRPVQADDEAFLYDVFVSSREDQFSLVDWPAEQLRALLRQQFELQQMGYRSAFRGADDLVILFKSEPAGRVLVHETDSEIRMVDITLLKPFRGLGIGREIVRGLMETAEKVRKPLRHHVFYNNADAIRFYVALGYEIIEKEEIGFQMQWTPASLRTKPQAEASRA